MGTKSYRPWGPNQLLLMPPSPREWLPEGHLAYFVLEVVERLANADEADRADDERFGVGVAPEDLPEELQRRERRIARIEEAMAELEEEAKATLAEELREKAEGQR